MRLSSDRVDHYGPWPGKSWAPELLFRWLLTIFKIWKAILFSFFCSSPLTVLWVKVAFSKMFPYFLCTRRNRMAGLHNIQSIERDKNPGEIFHHSSQENWTESQLSGISSHLVHGLQCVESCRADDDKWTVAIAKTSPSVWSFYPKHRNLSFILESSAMSLHEELSVDQ